MDGVLSPPFSLIVLEQTDSTNDEARRRAEQGAAAFTVIQADRQTAGRGRRGRTWQSPSGNLHCSILLPSGDNLAQAPQLAFVAAVALRQALAELVPAQAFSCKWPNDILCGGRKIAGMLLESAMPWIILGVGVDVAEAPPAEQLLYPATSLRKAGSSADALDLLRCFCDHLGPWYQRWRMDGFAPLRKAWLDHASGLGGPVTVRLADGQSLRGTLAGMGEQGALLMTDEDGHRRAILAGDVFFGP